MRRPLSALLLLLLSWLPLFAQEGTQHAESSRPSAPIPDNASGAATASQSKRFSWAAALGETALFLGIEHALNVQNYTDIPHDHFFRRYADSVRGYHFDRWNDGSPMFTNYVGHPFSGAAVGFIFLQNSPTGRMPRSAGEYWKSRLKATAWVTAYSVQWEMGPASESSLGNYGIYPYRDSKGHIVNSTGLVDLVLTPVGGLGWMLAEDQLDHRFISGRDRRGPAKTLLCIGVMPARSLANALRLKRPCYRDAE